MLDGPNRKLLHYVTQEVNTNLYGTKLKIKPS